MISSTTALYLTFLASFLSIGYAIFAAYYVLSKEDGNERMREIAKAIQEGAFAFLSREYKSIAIVAVVIFAILWALGAKSEHFGLLTALGYLTGAILSGLAGYIGMVVAVKTNVKTAQMAKNGLAKALNLAFRGGSVTGFLVTGFGLLAIAGFYYISVYVFKQSVEHTIKALIGLAFGTSLISVFARLGGGIYTKAADVGADLVGKVEAGIPEDDPRNPAVIADNVGDNVGDCAGMAADVFETFTVTTVASMVLGYSLFDKATGSVGVATMFPLLIGAIASVSAIIGTFFVKLGRSNNIMGAFYKGMLATAVIALVIIYFAAQKFFAGGIKYSWGVVTPNAVFMTALIGMAITALLMFITEYYTSYEYPPVKSIAKSSVTGHATNIIQGMAVMLKAPAAPAIVIALGIFFSYKLAGLYGIAIAAASMLSLTGMVISIDSYGPITDNAGGIAEMAELDESVRAVTDPLDAVGNTTKAVTKGFAIGSAALAALVLFAEYTRAIGGKTAFDLSDPLVLVGLLLGGLLPFYFGAMSMEAVGIAGGMMVEEVRRQFKTIKGILEGKAKPDYAACVDIVTRESLKKMIAPGLIPVLGPIIVYAIFGRTALGALSMGSIITGFFLAVAMTSGGGAWDNAKKYIEDGNFGGKGSEAHKAAVTGDTVGDPLKDTAGPAINPMIKIINIIAILIVLTSM